LLPEGEEVKLSLSLVINHTIEAQKEEKVLLHVYVTSALNGGEKLDSRPIVLLPRW
jgi:hypothetical protein